MIETADRITSSFALTVPLAPKKLPATTGASIPDAFAELCSATTVYSAQLKEAVERTAAAEAPPAEQAPGLLNRFLRHGVLGAFGGVVGAGAAGIFNLPVELILLASGALALLGGGVAECQHRYDQSRPKALPAPKVPLLPAPPQESLEDLLGRVHATDEFLPATLVALSAMAQDILDDKKQPLSEGVQAALADTVWHGESQEWADIARSARWVTLKRARDGVEQLADGENQWTVRKAYERVHEAFGKLEADEQVALAPVIREATFEGQKPRRKVDFEIARDLHMLLWTANPEPSAPIRDVPEPEKCAEHARFGREVFSLEEAIARAVDDGERCIATAACAVHKRHDVLVEWRAGMPLGMDPGPLRCASTANAFADAKVVGEAASRALAPWHTQLERAALALVAKRGLELLDLTRTLGSEVREMLTAIVKRGELEPEGINEATIKEAERLYDVLNTFNHIDTTTGTEDMVDKSVKMFHDVVRPVEKAGLALAIREHVLDVLVRNKKYFSGSVTLRRQLRDVIENG